MREVRPGDAPVLQMLDGPHGVGTRVRRSSTRRHALGRASRATPRPGPPTGDARRRTRSPFRRPGPEVRREESVRREAPFGRVDVSSGSGASYVVESQALWRVLGRGPVDHVHHALRSLQFEKQECRPVGLQSSRAAPRPEVLFMQRHTVPLSRHVDQVMGTREPLLMGVRRGRRRGRPGAGASPPDPPPTPGTTLLQEARARRPRQHPEACNRRTRKVAFI